MRNQKIKVKNILRSSKKLYYSKYFLENSKNAKKLWEGVNQILYSKTKTHSSIECLEQMENNNKITITNPKQISNIANNYYTNVAGDILKKRKYSGNKHFKQYLNNPNSQEFIINPTNQQEIEQIIKEFDPSKGVGPNSLPPQILKLIAPLVSKPLAEIFNKSFLSGIFPDSLKI